MVEKNEKKASDKQKEASKDSKNDKQDVEKADEKKAEDKKVETSKNDDRKENVTEEKNETSDDTVAKVGIGALVATALAGFGIVIGKKKKKNSK